MENICYFLAGIVVTLVGIWATHVKNAVTRKEMEVAIDKAQGAFTSALRANGSIMTELSSRVRSVELQMARISGERAASAGA